MILDRYLQTQSGLGAAHDVVGAAFVGLSGVFAYLRVGELLGLAVAFGGADIRGS